MATAPVVANLSDLIGQYTAAQAPQQAQLDSQSQENEQSGDAQVAGLGAAEKGAFGGITQQANNRGMFFSGFTPDAEAKYVGSTYLPALAKVQAAIAGVRDTIMGKKADLASSANTAAIGEQQNEQKELDQYNQDQADQEAALQRQQASDAAANQRAAMSASSGPSAADVRAGDTSNIAKNLVGASGSDNRVSPQTYAQQKSLWESLGYSGKDFDSTFAAYRNPSNKSYKLG